jgi:DNA-binding transcriptional ArsR family regulator
MTDAQLSTTFAALADPTRRAILSRLALGEATVAELARPHRLSGSAITKHLKVLQTAGLVVQGRRAQFRPCRLNPEPLAAAKAWLADREAFWHGQFDNLRDLLDAE